MTKVKQLADKDGELIYPVVDPTQLHFSGTQNDTVNGDGSIRSTYETNRKINFSAYGGTAIAENADLNTIAYLKVGRYFCKLNTTVRTLSNCPTTEAFTMNVYTSHDALIDDEQTMPYVYRVREIRDLRGNIWRQGVESRATAGAFIYGTWNKVLTDSNTPLCCAGVTGTATTNISSTSAWSEHNYTNLAQSKFITSNSSVFSFSNGGIKVSTSGFYVVSGEINVDASSGKSILLRINNSTKFTADGYMAGVMTGMALPAMVVQLSANDVVNLGYRLEDTNAHTTRGDRSQLSIVKIA